MACMGWPTPRHVPHVSLSNHPRHVMFEQTKRATVAALHDTASRLLLADAARCDLRTYATLWRMKRIAATGPFGFRERCPRRAARHAAPAANDIDPGSAPSTLPALLSQERPAEELTAAVTTAAAAAADAQQIY